MICQVELVQNSCCEEPTENICLSDQANILSSVRRSDAYRAREAVHKIISALEVVALRYMYTETNRLPAGRQRPLKQTST